MPEDNQFLSLGIDVDRRQVQQSKSSLEDLRKSTVSLTHTQTDSARSSRREGAALEDLDALRKQILRSTELRVDALKLEARQQQQLANAIEQTKRSTVPGRFEIADEFNSQIRERAGLIGDLDTALSALGATELGGAFGAVEGLAQLGGALRGLPASAEATVSALLGVEVSFGAIVAAAAPVAIAVGGIILAFKAFQKQLEESKKLLEGSLDAQRLYYEAVTSGTTESIQGQIDALKQTQEARQLEVDALTRQRAETTSLLTVMQQLAAIDVRNPVRAIIEFWGIIIGTLKGRGLITDQLKGARDELNDTNSAIAQLGNALDNQAVKNRSAADATDATSDAQKQAVRQQVGVTDAIKQASRSLADATQAEDKRTSAIERSTQAVQSNAQFFNNIAQGYQARLKAEKEGQAAIAQLQDEARQEQMDLVRDARRDLLADGRKLKFDLETLGIRAKADIFEQDLNRDFAGLGRTRRDLALDRAMTKRQAAFDREERTIQLRQAIDDKRIEADKRIAQEFNRISQELGRLTQQLIQQNLSARGLNVPSLVSAEVSRQVGSYFS